MEKGTVPSLITVTERRIKILQEPETEVSGNSENHSKGHSHPDRQLSAQCKRTGQQKVIQPNWTMAKPFNTNFQRQF